LNFKSAISELRDDLLCSFAVILYQKNPSHQFDPAFFRAFRHPAGKHKLGSRKSHISPNANGPDRATRRIGKLARSALRSFRRFFKAFPSHSPDKEVVLPGMKRH
jgi:hypothetical protein